MDRRVRILLSMLVLLALTSCVSAPPPPPPARREVPPTPVVALPPPAPLASDWRDWPQTPGDWNYAAKGNGTVATFGSAGSPAVALSCDRDSRHLFLSVSPSTARAVTVRTSTQTRALAVDEAGMATLSATDPLLDAIGFSRGRFVVEQPGRSPLVLPAWAEVERVVEDCRG